MEKSKLKVTTKPQFERLVKLMENNPDIAKGKQKFGMTKNQLKEAWEVFSIELNSLGPPIRTPTEWQRVWIHYKASVKKKLVNNKKNYQATGGGPSQEIALNNLEDSVSQLLSLNEQVAPAGRAFGVENIAAITSRASVSPQDPGLEEEITNENQTLNTPAKKKGNQ